MKKIYLLLLLASGFLEAQIINIPDPTFKSFLVNPQQNIDTNHDGQIQLSEAQATDYILLNSNVSDIHTVSSLEGIQYFTNLTILVCYSNLLTSLDVSALTHLKFLDCSDNQLTSLNVSGLTELEMLNCMQNQLTAINVTGLSNLTLLACSYNLLTDIDVSTQTMLETFNCQNNLLTQLTVSNLDHLIAIFCDHNQLTTINLVNLPAFAELECQNNQLTTLDVSGLGNLVQLICADNQLAALDLSMHPNMQYLKTDHNILTSLNITNLSHLTDVYCSHNQLATIDLTGLPQLKTLECQNNALTAIELSNLPLLELLNCGANQIAALDVSLLPQLGGLWTNDNPISVLDFHANTRLHYLNCSNNLVSALDFSSFNPVGNLWTVMYEMNDNPNLVNVNAKIGTFAGISVTNCPNLRYICYEDRYSWIPLLLENLALSGITNVEVNSYCSFEPTGVYNTISGTALFDAQNDGCDAADLPWQYIKVKLDDGTNSGTAFTDPNGNYSFHTGQGNFNLSLDIENASYFQSTTATVNFPDTNNNTQTVNLCLATNGVHPDLELVIVPTSLARPGFDSGYALVYKNKGNQILSGSIDFNYNEQLLDFVSVSAPIASQSAGQLSFDYANLSPFESRQINVAFNLNAPADTPAVNIGDVLDFSAAINPVAGDETPTDNVFDLHQTVVGSFDPNNKICLEGAQVNPNKIGDYLHYTINFENTGTAAAQNIVVRDIIDVAQFEIGSFQILRASHPMATRITGNKVEFIFENINLEAGEHGNVTFKVKTKNALVADSSVSNQADIYFDYNFPVVTDPAVTVFLVLGREDFKLDDSVSVAPNPASDLVKVKANSKIQSITLFDVQGRNLSTKLTNATQTALDIAHYPKGIYFLKVTTDKGSRVEKLIRK